MPRNTIPDLSTTDSENTDIKGVSVAEGMAPSGVNNAIRAMAAMLADAFSSAAPGTKLTAVKTADLQISDNTDKITLGTTDPTLVQHSNATSTTTVDAEGNLILEVGTQATPTTFKIDGFDATNGKVTVIQVGADNAITLGNTNAAATTAVTVNGTLAATNLTGDGTGLTGVTTLGKSIAMSIVFGA